MVDGIVMEAKGFWIIGLLRVIVGRLVKNMRPVLAEQRDGKDDLEVKQLKGSNCYELLE